MSTAERAHPLVDVMAPMGITITAAQAQEIEAKCSAMALELTPAQLRENKRLKHFESASRHLLRRFVEELEKDTLDVAKLKTIAEFAEDALYKPVAPLRDWRVSRVGDKGIVVEKPTEFWKAELVGSLTACGEFLTEYFLELLDNPVPDEHSFTKPAGWCVFWSNSGNSKAYIIVKKGRDWTSLLDERCPPYEKVLYRYFSEMLHAEAENKKASAQAQDPTHRAMFEQTVLETFLEPGPGILRKREDGHYVHPSIQTNWELWQAACRSSV